MFTIATPIIKNVFKIQGYVWLWMLHIFQNYALIVTIMVWSLSKKTQGSQPKLSKQEVWGKSKFAYMKLIKIHSCHTGVIFTPRHMTRKRQQCVHTHSQIMRDHIGNVYCDVVPNSQALIFPPSKQMISIPTTVLQFVLTFIILLHVVQNMAGFC